MLLLIKLSQLGIRLFVVERLTRYTDIRYEILLNFLVYRLRITPHPLRILLTK